MKKAGTPRGFTLLEICLAVFIAMLLVTLAVPSIEGVIAGDKNRESFERFDSLAGMARELAMSERRTYLLLWDGTGVLVRPEYPADKAELAGKKRLDFSREETCDVEFPAALVKKPLAKWIFWPTGTCETAKVTYHGPDGAWVAQYDPLTARADITGDEKK